jgi:hypothetical protein
LFALSVADPDPGSGAFLTPGSEMGKKSRSGSGMKNPDHISLLKFFDTDPGWKKFGSGMENVGSGIRDRHPGSETLLILAYSVAAFTFLPPGSGSISYRAFERLKLMHANIIILKKKLL